MLAREEVPDLPSNLTEREPRPRTEQQLAEVDAGSAQHTAGRFVIGEQLAFGQQDQTARDGVILDLLGDWQFEHTMGEDQRLVDRSPGPKLKRLLAETGQRRGRKRVEQGREICQPLEAKPGAGGAMNRKVGNLLGETKGRQLDARRNVHEVGLRRGGDPWNEAAVVGQSRVKIERIVGSAPDAFLAAAMPVGRVDGRLGSLLLKAQPREKPRRIGDRAFRNEDVEIGAGLQKRVAPGELPQRQSLQEHDRNAGRLKHITQALRVHGHAKAVAHNPPDVIAQRILRFGRKASPTFADGLPHEPLHPMPARHANQTVAIGIVEAKFQFALVQGTVAVAAAIDQQAKAWGHGTGLSEGRGIRPC